LVNLKGGEYITRNIKYTWISIMKRNGNITKNKQMKLKKPKEKVKRKEEREE